jgi:16S rRNA (guanine527-N7)-methyltransferase
VQLQQFWTFHQLLHRRNAELDLTRLHGFDTIVLKHYVDCVLVATLVDLPTPLLDLGTGPGFPGIPLKIVRPDVHVLLAEGRGKRVGFLHEAIRALGLRDIEVVPQRIGTGFDRPVRGVITRAVESVSATLGRVAPWLEPGARILFMKGPAVQEELDAACQRFGAHFGLVRDVPYSIPHTSHARRLVIFERSATAAPVEHVAPPREALSFEDEAEVDTGAETVAAGGGPEAAPMRAAAHDRAGGGRELRDIVSDANATFKLLKAVQTGRGIRKHGHALLLGIRPILEVLRDHPRRCVAWVTPGLSPAPPAEAPPGLAWYRVAPALFRDLDSFGTGPPLLLIEVPPLETWSDDDWPPGCTLFVPFQDPENVGAVLRTAAAFGVARAVLLQEAASPFHPRSARAAGSALLRIPLWRGPSIAALQPHGAPVLPLSATGRDAGEFVFPPSFGLLPGLEGPGLPESWRVAEALAVPMHAGSESRNAAAATAIVL